MKKRAFAVILIATTIIACNEEAPVYKFALNNFAFSECKNGKAAVINEQQSVEYRYSDGNQLFLKHKDVYFNCCQTEDNLQVDTRLAGDSIIVSEYEKVPGTCKCICPYDMECTVGPLQKKQYWIIIKTANIESFRFPIDFDEKLDGVKSL